tara:strand:- start:337 stop:1182 length:846 start_codon:yes stop_codon:yes gene_type:complete
MEIQSTKFRDVIDPLSDEERTGLEADIIANGGPNDPVWLWGVHIVDGHHRYDICTMHDLPYQTIQVFEDVIDESEVRGRIQMLAANQRNLTAEQERKYRVKAVYALSETRESYKAIEEVAKASGINPKTVRRDLKRHEAGQSLAPELQGADFVYKRIDPDTLELMAKLEPEVQVEIAERNGYDANKIAQDVVAQKTVKGSPVYDAAKARNKQRRKKTHAKRETRGVLQGLVNDLAELKKSANKVRKAIGVTDGGWSRMETAIDSVGIQIQQWRETLENDKS